MASCQRWPQSVTYFRMILSSFLHWDLFLFPGHSWPSEKIYLINALYPLLGEVIFEHIAAAAAAKLLQLCLTLCDFRQQPTRLLCPWDSPGKNTGVGCHFLLQCMKVKSESEVAQSCLTLRTPWTAAYKAPPPMGFSRQEYWSGVPLPSPYLNTLKNFK